jgi:hypothetical protein
VGLRLPVADERVEEAVEEDVPAVSALQHGYFLQHLGKCCPESILVLGVHTKNPFTPLMAKYQKMMFNALNSVSSTHSTARLVVEVEVFVVSDGFVVMRYFILPSVLALLALVQERILAR